MSTFITYAFVAVPSRTDSLVHSVVLKITSRMFSCVIRSSLPLEISGIGSQRCCIAVDTAMTFGIVAQISKFFCISLLVLSSFLGLLPFILSCQIFIYVSSQHQVKNKWVFILLFLCHCCCIYILISLLLADHLVLIIYRLITQLYTLRSCAL